MTTHVKLDDGTLVPKKDYITAVFEQHLDKSKWLSSFSSRTSHLIIEHTERSPSLCARMFKTKDLFSPKESGLDFKRCKTCERALAKLINEAI